MRREEIHRFAEGLMAKYYAADPYQLAAAVGAEIRYFHFEELRGAYKKIRRCRFILVNERLPEPVRRVVVAHELGHIFLHDDIAGDSFFQENTFFDMTSKPEMEANIFAASILVSDEEMLSADTEPRELPYEVLLIKAQDMRARGYEISLPSIPRADFLAGGDI